MYTNLLDPSRGDMYGDYMTLLHAQITRELTEEELDTAPAPANIAAVKRITDRHRRMARMLASGCTPGEVCAATNITGPRLSVLQNDPSFKALVEFYRTREDEEYSLVQQRLEELGGAAIDEIQDRLETSPEGFDIDDLLEVGKFAFDRSGHGPASKTTQTNVNVNIAARLEEAQRRMKDITPKGDN